MTQESKLVKFYPFYFKKMGINKDWEFVEKLEIQGDWERWKVKKGTTHDIIDVMDEEEDSDNK